MESVSVKVFKGPHVAAGAKLASRARLYVPGWALGTELYLIEHPGRLTGLDRREIALCYVGETPVAIVLRLPADQWSRAPRMMAFCRKAHRRKGYASRCVKALGAGASAISAVADVGIKDSERFWQAQGVRLRGGR